MARIIGEIPEHMSPAEDIMYHFVRTELPDYISVSMFPDIPAEDDIHKVEFDMLLFIPHMGVFILEIRDVIGFAYQDCAYYYMTKTGKSIVMDGERRARRLQRQGFVLRDYLKKKFNIAPLIYEFECFPYISMRGLENSNYPADFDPSHVIMSDDLHSGLHFLHKLIGITIMEQQQKGLAAFEDLSDKDAHDILYFWKTGLLDIPRPERPPLVFLSYNRNNNEISKEIQTVLEDRGIFVWRAPKDVPLGEYYLPSEMKAIEECDVFLILLSIPAQNSEEVKKEFQKALEIKKPILPVWVEDVAETEIAEYYKENLTEYQYRVMTKIDINVINEIVATVKKIKREDNTT
jgi:hypothetical protein